MPLSPSPCKAAASSLVAGGSEARELVRFATPKVGVTEAYDANSDWLPPRDSAFPSGPGVRYGVPMLPVFLTVDDVLHIHSRVCNDFANTDDPVDSPGVRDQGMLESAVGRQQTGCGEYLKYDTVWSNAATLGFGICCNHAFHNGNKRTALVSMIAHLEANKHTLFGTKQSEMYSMIKEVAKHSFGRTHDPRAKRRPVSERDADREVEAIAKWLRKRARRIERDERRITHRQLRKILAQHGIEMRDPRNGAIIVGRRFERRTPLLQKRERFERVCTIGYRGETQLVGLRDIRRVRELCELDDEHGVDSRAFYKSEDPVDVWINDYRSVLERLSKE
jgi:death on curing protein